MIVLFYYYQCYSSRFVFAADYASLLKHFPAIRVFFSGTILFPNLIVDGISNRVTVFLIFMSP